MSQILKFGVFEVDPRAGELRKQGMRQKLAGQPMQLLVALLERPQEVVTRGELRRVIWPENVSLDYDLALKKAVNRAREALGDSAESPRYIETIPRKGYRFVAPVTLVNRANGHRQIVDRETAFRVFNSDLKNEATGYPVATYAGISAEREIALWRHLAIALAVLLAAIVTIAWITYGRSARSFRAGTSTAARYVVRLPNQFDFLREELILGTQECRSRSRIRNAQLCVRDSGGKT